MTDIKTDEPITIAPFDNAGEKHFKPLSVDFFISADFY